MTISPSQVNINLWPDRAPGEITSNPGHVLEDRGGNVARLTDVTAPQLTVYMHRDLERRPTILVCPGGGYEILAIDLEGTEVAEWLFGLGYTVAILQYRVPNNRVGALQDGQRALSLLRFRSNEFGIDVLKLGVLGFSAGAHLAIRLAATGSDRSYHPVDAVDLVSCAPAFALGIYPAYLIESESGKPSAEVAPHSGMPPIFLMQSRDDQHFCVEKYAEFLKNNGVMAALVVYDKGGHGYGIRLATDIPAPPWTKEAEVWLREVAS